jgi:hypothetical protein
MSSDGVHTAKEMLAKHGKSTLIGLIMGKCDGSITVQAPYIHQQYGRPRHEFLNAETVAVDLQRCAISEQDVANHLRRQAQKEQRLANLPPPRKRRTSSQSVVGGPSEIAMPSHTPHQTSTSSGLRPAELAKLRAIEKREMEDTPSGRTRRTIRAFQRKWGVVPRRGPGWHCYTNGSHQFCNEY